jgi:hypothetical protein
VNDPQTEMPAAEPPTSIAGMLDAINTNYVELERYVAGYNTLVRAYQTATDQLPAGQRPKGLMLTFKGSVDDIHAIDVMIDVQKHVDPRYAPNVLAPLASGQAAGMLAAVERLIASAVLLRDQIRVAVGPPPAAPSPVPPG